MSEKQGLAHVQERNKFSENHICFVGTGASKEVALTGC